MKKEFNPLVSIVIPVYNGSNYLREAIDSALMQTYQNCEILVVNDGSNDGGETEKIALEYGDKIRYFVKENGGVATALNMAIENMRGEYFSWLSHDDLYHENKISKQVKALSALKDKTTLVSCGYKRIFEGQETKNGVKEFDEAADYTDEQLATPLFILLRTIFGFAGLIFGCSLFIHKSHFERVGTFNVNSLCNDIDLWFRMMRNQPLVYVREPLSIKRLHEGQDTITKVKELVPAFNDFIIEVLEKLTEQEVRLVFGSKLKLYTHICNIYLGTEIALYAISKAMEERLKLFRKCNTADEKKDVLLSGMMFTKEKHEQILEEVVRGVRLSYENSHSWELTKPLRAVRRLFEKGKQIGVQ
ncbi:MAG: glycosyltransferase [Oscillospiraceae bacterium]|nr:glycosyltransferase [Oscillospiraceae bacterium]